MKKFQRPDAVLRGAIQSIESGDARRRRQGFFTAGMALAFAAKTDLALQAFERACSGFAGQARMEEFEEAVIVRRIGSAIVRALGRDLPEFLVATGPDNRWEDGARSRLLMDRWSKPRGSLNQATEFLRTAQALLQEGRTLAALGAAEQVIDRRAEVDPWVVAEACIVGAVAATEAGREDLTRKLLIEWWRCDHSRHLGQPFAFPALAREIVQGALAEAAVIDRKLVATIERVVRGEPSGLSPAFSWASLLERLEKVLERSRKKEELGNSSSAPPLQDPVGSFRAKGASPEEIELAEKRLGCKLPASYRAFLLVSNGPLIPNHRIDRLRPISEVRHIREDPVADGWLGEELVKDTSGSPYVMENGLAISDHGDAGFLYLNPDFQDEEGEWEAWHVASWIPGEHRYGSFRSYMEETLAFLDELAVDEDGQES